jgi:acyl-homoserine lactone acylase PvdQ
MRHLRRAAAAATALTAVLAAGAAPAAAVDATGLDGVWSIMPPGADGTLNGPEALAARAGQLPPHVADQLAMYGDLVYDDATPGFREDQLDDYFKVASFDVPDDQVERRYGPAGRSDVEVVRDRFGVPHITGETREAAMFGQGYAAAEDRLFLMDALRRVGRGELSAWLGPSAGNRALDAEVLAEAPYTESDLTAQLDALAARGPHGQQAVADNRAYIAGISAYVAEARRDPTKLPAEYLALQLVPEEFVPEDVVANSAFIGGIFGNGGGTEVRNLCAIRTLEGDLGAQRARAVFDDLRFADDAEAPVTTQRPFPFLTDLGPVDPAAVPDLDCDSLTPVQPPATPSDGATVDVPLVASSPLQTRAAGTIDLPWGSVDLRPPDAMSNALLVSAERSATGAPLAVMGPQTGYFVPQLFWERSVQAPGYAARGVGIAGGGSAVTIGRGLDYAWSVTSGNADNIDQFVLELCEPGGGAVTVSSMGYRRGASCVPIETHEKVLVAKPSAGGLPGSPDEVGRTVVRKYFERAPHYGPVNARGTLRDGTPVAVARARSTYLDEVRGSAGFVQINDPELMAGGFQAFRRAIVEVGYTYNWLWADQRDIGYQLSCACPRRTPGVDTDLPVRGDGTRDWRDRLGTDELPHDMNPPSGYLLSWNNRQAPQWRTSDSQFGWGPVHRSQLLERRIDAVLRDGPVTIGEVVDVTQLAGTTDLRGQEVLPHALRLMGARPDGDADERTVVMAELLRAWIGSGSHRRDHDRDGAYEHAVAAAVVDAWWEPLVDAVLQEGTADARRVIGITLHDDHKDGSAFQDSLYAHVQKDLRQVQGERVVDPFSRTYCGGGDPQACRTDLWRSLEVTADRLEEEFGSADVDDWQRTPEDEQIRHGAIGVTPVPPIHWVNRPTFQQVVAFPPEQAAATATTSGGDTVRVVAGSRTTLPATGGTVAVLALVALTAAAALRRAVRSR